MVLINILKKILRKVKIIIYFYLISLKIVLEKGDIVERHLIDGDIVLFNRQPTLHKEISTSGIKSFLDIPLKYF